MVSYPPPFKQVGRPAFVGSCPAVTTLARGPNEHMVSIVNRDTLCVRVCVTMGNRLHASAEASRRKRLILQSVLRRGATLMCKMSGRRRYVAHVYLDAFAGATLGHGSMVETHARKKSTKRWVETLLLTDHCLQDLRAQAGKPASARKSQRPWTDAPDATHMLALAFRDIRQTAAQTSSYMPRYVSRVF